jgi:hypothetical protein
MSAIEESQPISMQKFPQAFGVGEEEDRMASIRE